MAHGPQKAKFIALDRKASTGKLVGAALASASEQMRFNVDGARRDHDPDFTHQLRVGARRARVVLRLFKKPIGKRRVAALERDLRWVFRQLGELRDYDLLLREVVEPLALEELQPALELLATELGKQRKRAARSVKRALASKRFTRLMLALRELQQELPGRDDLRKRARKWARRRLDKRLERVLARRAAALGPDESARHELRKELKKLRYAAELVRSLWGKKRVKHYLTQMEALQDTLGALNDVATGRRLLPVAAASAAGDTSAAVELCERSLLARLSQQAPGLEPAFRGFEATPPFWR